MEAQDLSERLETPVRGDYDVLVVGGGVGGLCAAAAAARMGASVLMIEKSVVLGGLATAGLISWYEPLCDGHGRKVMYGMAAELMRLAVEEGPHSLAGAWQGDPDEAAGAGRYACHFSPARFSMALDAWLLDSGAELLLDSWAVRPVMREKQCLGVVVENKTGRGFYQARVVVDASGDAELLYKAGMPTEAGENFLTYIAYTVDAERLRAAKDSGNMIAARVWKNSGADLWGGNHPEGYPRLSGTTAEEITRFVLDGRARLRQQTEGCRDGASDVTCLPGMPQLRTVRRLCGAYTLTEADAGASFADSVGVVADFANPGALYQIPLRTLYAPGFGNLLTCGRTISSTGWAWDVTRVIPAAVCSGQAAGVAAALVARGDCPVSALAVEAVQAPLLRDGVRLQYPEGAWMPIS